MTTQGPLSGIRVIDLTHDLGRFGTKLLAEFGAEVCRPQHTGSSGRAVPGVAGDHGGVLDWWFDVAKTPIELDLDRPSGLESYRSLASSADIIVESTAPGYLTALGIDHEHLVHDNPTLTQVSLTPFGRTGPRSAWQSSDLVAGALGGVLSITGEPDSPLNSWGWQNYNFGGFAAALCAMAGVRRARETGRGQLVDLSLHEVVVGSIENLFMQYFYDDLLPLPKVATRQGSLHWLGAYEVVPAKTGNVMITPTPQAEQLVEWMVETGIEEAEPFVGMPVEELLAAMPELMKAVKKFTLTADAGDLVVEAQAKHIAFGEVQSVAQVADNPQFAHRGLFSDVELGDGSAIRAPWRLVRFGETPVATPAPPPIKPSEVAEVASVWSSSQRKPSGAGGDKDTDRRGPLDGLVVVDLSWVLAGPFATRLLGDLGADVIKIQTEERATLVNRPDFPYYPVWNRSKRSATLNLKHPDALEVLKPLIQRADVLVENYSSGVLDRLGLGWEAVREWNDQLVYISMSGCGHEGPWRNIISYAPTIHALCGLTHLTNPAERGDIGCGFSLNDHAAGFAAASSVLAAVLARAETGVGQHIDMAQLEVGAYLVGPAMLDYWATGNEAQPAGNRDPFVDFVPNGVFECSDGRFLAVSATDEAMWGRLATLIGMGLEPIADNAERIRNREHIDATIAEWCRGHSGDEAMRTLQGCGVAAGVVQDAGDLAERDEQLSARGFWLDAEHDEFGRRPHDRFPAMWSGADLEPYRRAPSYLGEANFEVWPEYAGLDIDVVAEGIAGGLFT